MGQKYRLKGHESFILREGWLNKGLLAVHNNPQVFSVNLGADALGVGSNMAKAIRYWLKVANLIIENRQGTFLSPLGEIILQYDPYIEDVFTLNIIHQNIISQKENATSWYLFFNDFEIEEFTKDEVFHQFYQKLSKISEGENISDRSLSEDISCIFRMYSKDKETDIDPEEKKRSPFVQLGLLHEEGNKYYKKQPNTTQINEFAVMYSVQRMFDKTKTNSISIDDLLYLPNSPGKLLNIKRYKLIDYLDSLSNKGLVVLNQTAGLDMVYQNTQMNENEIVSYYYENR